LRGQRGGTAGLAGRERAAWLWARPATSSSRSSVGAPRSSSCRRRPLHWPTGPWMLLTGRPRAEGGLGGTRTPAPDSSAPHAPRSRNWARSRLAHRRHPACRARREALGLPRSGDPLRTLLGAAAAGPLRRCHRQV